VLPLMIFEKAIYGLQIKSKRHRSVWILIYVD